MAGVYCTYIKKYREMSVSLEYLHVKSVLNDSLMHSILVLE